MLHCRKRGGISLKSYSDYLGFIISSLIMWYILNRLYLDKVAMREGKGIGKFTIYTAGISIVFFIVLFLFADYIKELISP